MGDTPAPTQCGVIKSHRRAPWLARPQVAGQGPGQATGQATGDRVRESIRFRYASCWPSYRLRRFQCVLSTASWGVNSIQWPGKSLDISPNCECLPTIWVQEIRLHSRCVDEAGYIYIQIVVKARAWSNVTLVLWRAAISPHRMDLGRPRYLAVC